MKAKAEKYGQGNKGGLKKMSEGKMDAEALKKGAIAEAKEPMDESDSESADHMEDAETAGLPKSKVGAQIHKMPMNLMKDQSGIHEAAGFVSNKSDY